MLVRALALILTCLVLESTASAQGGDPRAPGAIALFEIGRLYGSLKQVTAMDESFGRTLYPLGDVNGDGLGDWILAHRRCDTSFDGYAVVELLTYTGVRDGLPRESAGERIGPSEIKSDCGFVGVGDYDGDGHRDIAIMMRVLDDPSTLGWWITSVVVYWGNGSGHFTNADTTHLTGPTERLSNFDGPDLEVVAKTSSRLDFDGDGVDDLLVMTKGQKAINRVLTPMPYMMIYRGHRGGRWGRNGVSALPDWQLWQKHFQRRVSVLDHDGDGVLDIVMFVERGNPTLAQVAVLYGVRGGLPDTVAERIVFPSFEGQPVATCELVDVTGDQVPELISVLIDSLNGSESDTRRWLVYVGQRGQRLLVQFGSGNDAPNPGDSLWWGRPWTILMPPSSFSSSWYAPARVILDPGDIGYDGVGDFCALSWPTVICYNGGAFLDWQFDAWISNVHIAELDRGRLVQLGDIDGSRQPALGVALGEGGVAFIRGDQRVPRGGVPIRLPEGSDRPSSSPVGASPGGTFLDLTISPNPASAEAQVRWTAPSKPAGSSLILHDPVGRELRRWVLPEGMQQLTIDLTGLPAGLYFVRLQRNGLIATTAFIHTD